MTEVLGKKWEMFQISFQTLNWSLAQDYRNNSKHVGFIELKDFLENRYLTIQVRFSMTNAVLSNKYFKDIVAKKLTLPSASFAIQKH